jgi:hypothetical protein
MAQVQDPGAGLGNPSTDTTDPLVCWEEDIETSSVSSDSSDEHVDRNADRARRRRELEDWVDVEEDNHDGAGSESESGSEIESERNSEIEESEEPGAARVRVHVQSRVSAEDKLKVREMLLKLVKIVSRDSTERDELAVSLASFGVTVTDLRDARRGSKKRQESDLGSVGSRGETETETNIDIDIDIDGDGVSGMAPGPDEESWTGSDSDSGDEGDHEVRSVSSGSGEEAGEDESAGTPGSSLAASASSTQFGVGCGRELGEE